MAFVPKFLGVSIAELGCCCCCCCRKENVLPLGFCLQQTLYGFEYEVLGLAVSFGIPTEILIFHIDNLHYYFFYQTVFYFLYYLK